MDLEKVSDEEKLHLCKRFFFIGLAMLPFLWLVNFVWFFRQAFLRKPFPQQRLIKQFVWLSGAGCLFWILVGVVWQVIFQRWRASASYAADHMSFVFPLGYA